VPSSCALLGGLAVGAQVSLSYDNIAPNAKCQRMLLLSLCLVINMAALRSRCGHYVFVLFLLFLFLP